MDNVIPFAAYAALIMATLTLAVTAFVLMRRANKMQATTEWRRGYDDGRADVIKSIRYEQEIYECRRSGMFKKEITLRIRERVMLGNLRIAEADREVTISAEVNEVNVWRTLEQLNALSIVNPAAATVRRIIGPWAEVLRAKAS